MEKDFDRWNEIKKKLDLRNISETTLLFPKRRQVWTSILGKNIGRELNGGPGNFSRPVLIIKKFDNEIFLVVPLSSKHKNNDFYYNFDSIHKYKGSVVLSQMRLVSVKRLVRYMYMFPEEHFEEILRYIRDFLI